MTDAANSETDLPEPTAPEPDPRVVLVPGNIHLGREMVMLTGEDGPVPVEAVQIRLDTAVGPFHVIVTAEGGVALAKALAQHMGMSEPHLRRLEVAGPGEVAVLNRAARRHL